MMHKHCFAVILMGVLSACSLENLAEKGAQKTYPNGERFAFQDAAGENIMKYACEKGPTDAATRKRAKAAHVYYDKTLQVFSDGLATEMLEKLAQGEGTLKIALNNNKKSEAWAQQTQDKLKADYQCINYGFDEVG